MARKALPQIDFIYENRQCGGCTACCHSLGIEELGKPYYIDCKNQTATGCSLHLKPDKPASCSKYKCAWLSGEFELEDRPDKSGVFFHAMAEDDGTLWMEGFLVRPNINNAQVQKMIQYIVSAAGRIRLFRFDQIVNCAFPLDEVTYPNLPNHEGHGLDFFTKNGSIWFLKAPKRIPLPVVTG